MSSHPTYGTIVQTFIPNRYPFTTMTVATSNGYLIEVLPRSRNSNGWENVISIVNIVSAPAPPKPSPLAAVPEEDIDAAESFDE